MKKVQAGDSSAYDLLLTDIYEGMMNYIRKQNPHNAEEVMQEVLTTLHQVRHTWNPSRPFNPWLMAIVQHRLADSRRAYWRHERRKTEVMNQEKMLEASYSNQSSSDNSLRDAVNTLPERQRAIVTLSKYFGLTNVEIGKKLNISEGAVKVTAHRAYQKLRDLLTKDKDEF
jgi:RNA polymerase sigma-70 factor (ECF subfamily)